MLITRHRVLLLLNAVWAIPCVLLLRLARPFVTIQICRIFSERIGHFVQDSSEHLARQFQENGRTIDLYYFGEVSNEQWRKMVLRAGLKVFGPWLQHVGDWNRIIPGGTVHILPSSLTNSRDIHGFFAKSEIAIPFSEDETALAHSYLESKGWKQGEPFVCLLVRDSAYLQHYNLVGGINNTSHHNYRDSDIQTYVPSMEWLAAQGVWVLRMGKLMETGITLDNARIIDYAFDPNKSDLLDIWLFANCTGVISTGSGLDMLAAVYGKQQLFVNILPVSNFWSWAQTIWVPKNLIWRKTGRSLTFMEYLQFSFVMTEDYSAAEIQIRDLSENEILEATQEFWQRITGAWHERPGEEAVQNRCWDYFKSMSNFSELHGWKNPESRLGYSWLLSKGDTFLETEILH